MTRYSIRSPSLGRMPALTVHGFVHTVDPRGSAELHGWASLAGDIARSASDHVRAAVVRLFVPKFLSRNDQRSPSNHPRDSPRSLRVVSPLPVTRGRPSSGMTRIVHHLVADDDGIGLCTDLNVVVVQPGQAGGGMPHVMHRSSSESIRSRNRAAARTRGTTARPPPRPPAAPGTGVDDRRNAAVRGSISATCADRRPRAARIGQIRRVGIVPRLVWAVSSAAVRHPLARCASSSCFTSQR